MEEKLKEVLRFQRENGFKFEGLDKQDLLEQLLLNIGDTDSENRDMLVYPNLAHLLHDNHFEKDKLIEVTELLISDQYLTFDMENKNEYSVLKRSFTLLQLVILVYVHNRDDIFKLDMVGKIINSFFDYFVDESILQGYKEEVGWMHSIAHSADLFSQVFKMKEFTEEEAKKSLLLIRDKFMISTYNYVSDEDERMTTAIVNLLNKKLVSDAFLLDWIKGFDTYDSPKEYPQVYTFKNNRKNLLRSIYFRVLENKDHQYLLEPIKTKIIENEGIR